jgi:hypothetical protein
LFVFLVFFVFGVFYSILPLGGSWTYLGLIFVVFFILHVSFFLDLFYTSFLRYVLDLLFFFGCLRLCRGAFSRYCRSILMLFKLVYSFFFFVLIFYLGCLVFWYQGDPYFILWEVFFWAGFCAGLMLVAYLYSLEDMLKNFSFMPFLYSIVNARSYCI